MAIGKDTVKKVASISRIHLTDEEADKFAKDFDSILKHFSSLDEIKKLPEPSFHPLPLEDRVREDIPEQSWDQDIALANTENKEKGFFKGPRAV